MTVKKKYRAEDVDQSESMVFGFDRITDEKSLAVFLHKFSSPELSKVLLPRLEYHEIEAIIHLLTGLMKKHLHKNEYHHLFLDGNN